MDKVNCRRPDAGVLGGVRKGIARDQGSCRLTPECNVLWLMPASIMLAVSCARARAKG